MFLVSFHESVDNLHAYDDNGKLREAHVLHHKGQALKELRGVYRDPVSGLLYVANGGKATSNVLCFQGKGTEYHYLSTFIPAATTDSPSAVIHPYGLAFDGAGKCYVSNQDSNAVAGYAVSSDGKTGTALYPQSPYLAGLKIGTFLNGTAVASQVGGLPEVLTITKTPPPDVTAAQGGLGVSPATGKVQHSVRGVLVTAGLLYACDEAGGVVRVYDAVTGTPVLASDNVGSPVQLLLVGGTVYVAAGKHVYTAPVLTSAKPGQTWALAKRKLTPEPDGDVSGIAFDGQGHFHVAVRKSKAVFKYKPDFSGGTPWPANPLPDNPEFLLYVPG